MIFAEIFVQRVKDRLYRHNLLVRLTALGRTEPDQSCVEVALAVHQSLFMQVGLVCWGIDETSVTCKVLELEASPVVITVKEDALDLTVAHLKDIILAVHLFKEVTMVLS